MGKYNKTAISFYGRDQIRDIFIQYYGGNLLLIYGDLVIPTSVFTEKGRKIIRRHNFWKVGKPNDDNQNFITIYFNDDKYISLSSALSDVAAFNHMIQSSHILEYLEILVRGGGAGVGGGDMFVVHSLSFIN